MIEDVGYGRELQADVRGFVDVRLRSLRTGSAGRFFEGGHPADIGELLRRHVVLAIEDVANDEDKAFLIGTLIIRIVEHLRLRARAEPADGLRARDRHRGGAPAAARQPGGRERATPSSCSRACSPRSAPTARGSSSSSRSRPSSFPTW